MTTVIKTLATYSSYRDRKFEGTEEDWNNAMEKSTTLYVGNLSFHTTEEQIYELFSKAGEVKRVIMGLDRNNRTPCGFCFVEYFDRSSAMDCLKFVNGTKLDERVIRTDIDPGFKDGRQFGRGRSGGQVRDEFRTEYDSGRGGWGPTEKYRQDRERERKQRHTYENFSSIPSGSNVDSFGRSLDLRNNIKRTRNQGSSQQTGGTPSSSFSVKRSRDEDSSYNKRFRDRNEDSDDE